MRQTVGRALGALLCGAAAQTTLAVTPDSSTSNATKDIEEIVVVADLQATIVELGPLGTLDILTTPYSVNSVTADTLELRQTRTLIELQKTDPSAQFIFNGFGAPLVAIRGFRADVRLDGTRSSISSQFPLEFVERIDLFKGANSFLYGFAAPGGVVNYALKHPGPDAFVTTTLSYRSDANVLGRVDINQPVTDQFGVRVNSLYERGDTYLEGDDQDRVAASIAADWRPSDTVRLQGDFTYQRNAPDSGGNATVLPLPGVKVPSPLNPERRYLQPWERFKIKLYAYGISGEWDFSPGWTLSARARGFIQPRTYYSSGGQTLDASQQLTNSIFAFNDGQDSFAQDATLSTKQWLGPSAHNLTLSLDRQYDPTYTGRGFGFVSVGPYPINAPIVVPRPADFRLPDDDRYKSGRTIQDAVMIADRIEWESWIALLALRDISYSQRNTDASGATTSHDNVRRFTPTVGLLRQFGDSFSAYASYAQSLEQGETPPVSATNSNPTPLPPVESDQFEVGVKAELFGNVTATAAVFHLERDYQASTFLADGVTPAFIEDGTQVHDGLEVSLSGMVAPRWNVIAGVTLLDANVEDASGFAVDGDTPVGVAQFQATLFLEHQIADWLFINGSVFHASSREIDSPNDRHIDGFTTVDGGIRVVREFGGRVISVNAMVENIFDERYWGGVYFGFLSLGSPRQAKVTLSVGF